MLIYDKQSLVAPQVFQSLSWLHQNWAGILSLYKNWIRKHSHLFEPQVSILNVGSQQVVLKPAAKSAQYGKLMCVCCAQTTQPTVAAQLLWSQLLTGRLRLLLLPLAVSQWYPWQTLSANLHIRCLLAWLARLGCQSSDLEAAPFASGCIRDNQRTPDHQAAWQARVSKQRASSQYSWPWQFRVCTFSVVGPRPLAWHDHCLPALPLRAAQAGSLPVPGRALQWASASDSEPEPAREVPL